jgi:hypothetical protein
LTSESIRDLQQIPDTVSELSVKNLKLLVLRLNLPIGIFQAVGQSDDEGRRELVNNNRFYAGRLRRNPERIGDGGCYDIGNRGRKTAEQGRERQHWEERGIGRRVGEGKPDHNLGERCRKKEKRSQTEIAGERTRRRCQRESGESSKLARCHWRKTRPSGILLRNMKIFQVFVNFLSTFFLADVSVQD